ncbi:MAG: hypothetical protein JZD40_02310 [Sulfolobus sp.]|nr:hypothetical protein [Sulfolobus sp.]
MGKSPSSYTTPKVRLAEEFVPVYVYEERKASKAKRINSGVTCIRLGKGLIYYSLFPFSIKEVEADKANLSYLVYTLMLGDPQVVYDKNKVITQKVINRADERRKRLKTIPNLDPYISDDLWNILSYSKSLINDLSISRVEYEAKLNKKEKNTILRFREDFDYGWSKTFELPLTHITQYFSLRLPEVFEGFFRVRGHGGSFTLSSTRASLLKGKVHYVMERNDKPGSKTKKRSLFYFDDEDEF